MLNNDISKNIISKSKSIINNTYKLVEIQKKDTITEKKTYSNLSFMENYSELIYSSITKSINHILTQNNIIKMPIIYHNNIYFIEKHTESPINHVLKKRYNTIEISMSYDNNKQDITSIVNINNSLLNLNQQEIMDNKIITPFLTSFYFKKTKDIVNTLNTQLMKHGIQIKKAFLNFCCKLGSKNSFESVLPELLLEYIYLTTIINVFDHFEFEYINKEELSSINIVEPVIIYKALSDKTNIDIEAYKSGKEVIFDFKRKYNLPLFEE